MNVIQDNRSPQAPDRPLDQKLMTSPGSSLCPGEGFASYLKMIISHQKGKNIETFARKHHALLSTFSALWFPSTALVHAIP